MKRKRLTMKRWIVAGSMAGGIVVLAAARRRCWGNYQRFFRRETKQN
jgi:hypothetical protein